jgi:hypothetical protein
MCPTSIRYNIYLLKSGRVVFRCKKQRLAVRSQRIAAGVRPDQLDAVKRLFVKTTDNGFYTIEATAFARDGRTPPDSAHKHMVAIYRDKIKQVLRGARVGPAMLEAAK